MRLDKFSTLGCNVLGVGRFLNLQWILDERHREKVVVGAVVVAVAVAVAVVVAVAVAVAVAAAVEAVVELFEKQVDWYQYWKQRGVQSLQRLRPGRYSLCC